MTLIGFNEYVIELQIEMSPLLGMSKVLDLLLKSPSLLLTLNSFKEKN